MSDMKDMCGNTLVGRMCQVRVSVYLCRIFLQRLTAKRIPSSKAAEGKINEVVVVREGIDGFSDLVIRSKQRAN